MFFRHAKKLVQEVSAKVKPIVENRSVQNISYVAFGSAVYFWALNSHVDGLNRWAKEDPEGFQRYVEEVKNTPPDQLM